MMRKKQKTMKVWVVIKELRWLEDMQRQGKQREITISNFRRFNDDSEIEVEMEVIQ